MPLKKVGQAKVEPVSDKRAEDWLRGMLFLPTLILDAALCRQQWCMPLAPGVDFIPQVGGKSDNLVEGWSTTGPHRALIGGDPLLLLPTAVLENLPP